MSDVNCKLCKYFDEANPYDYDACAKLELNLELVKISSCMYFKHI